MYKTFQNHLLCVFVANLKIDAIYALYPESFCDKNLVVRKVFAFSDSDVLLSYVLQMYVWKAYKLQGYLCIARECVWCDSDECVLYYIGWVCLVGGVLVAKVLQRYMQGGEDSRLYILQHYRVMYWLCMY